MTIPNEFLNVETPIYYVFKHNYTKVSPSVIPILEKSYKKARLKFYRILLNKKFIAVHSSYDILYIKSVHVDTTSKTTTEAYLNSINSYKKTLPFRTSPIMTVGIYQQLQQYQNEN